MFIKKRRRAQQIVCVSYSVSISTLAAFIIKVRARLRAGNSPTKTNNSLAPPSQKIPYSSPKKKNPRDWPRIKKSCFFDLPWDACVVLLRGRRDCYSQCMVVWCRICEEAPAASPLRAPCAPRRALSADVPPVCLLLSRSPIWLSLRTICCVHPSTEQSLLSRSN